MQTFVDAGGTPIQVGDYVAYGSGRGEISFGLITAFDDFAFDDPSDAGKLPQHGGADAHRHSQRHLDKYDRRTCRYPTKVVKHGPGVDDWHLEWDHERAYIVQVQRLPQPSSWRNFSIGSGGKSWLGYPDRIVKINKPVWA